MPESIATRPFSPSCLTSHSAHSVACSSYERATVEIAPESPSRRPAHSTTGMPCLAAAWTWPVMPAPIGTTTIASGSWEASCWMLSTCLVASPFAEA